MSDNITISQTQWRNLNNKIDFLMEVIIPLAKNYKQSKWMTEAEVIEATGLSVRSLRDKRKDCVFNWSSASGRKIKYLRADIEAYLNDNSTIRKNPLKKIV